jgi:pimeloyl-ACP methyl ester carboxylesterase
MASSETLYLLPGLLCDALTFARQREALERDCDVRVLDFFGLDSMTAMAKRVLADAPETFSVCGFSMGGRVALQILRLAPQRIARLCLLDTGVTPATPEEPAKRRELVDLAYAQGMKALAARWLPPMLNPARWGEDALVGPLTEMVCRATPDIFAGQIRALLTRPDARPLLPAIRCPTLVMAGALDAWSTPESHAQFVKMIPGAQLTIVPDSGHFLPVEQPEALTRALRAWMQIPARTG